MSVDLMVSFLFSCRPVVPVPPSFLSLSQGDFEGLTPTKDLNVYLDSGLEGP